MLEDIKALLEIEITDTSKDTVLNLYIRKATTAIKNYLNNDNFDYTYIQTNFTDAIIELVVNSYNLKVNTKIGIKQEQQGSRSTVYADNITQFALNDNIKNLLPMPYLKLR